MIPISAKTLINGVVRLFILRFASLQRQYSFMLYFEMYEYPESYTA